MKTNILIQSRPYQTRIAQISDKDILTYKIQDSVSVPTSMVGSIYMGKVSKILPGMSACFVDIGETEGFLHSKEIFSDNKPPESIQKILKTGQMILVQVIKDPINHKSCQLSTVIRLTGAKLVYMPQIVSDKVGISKRIENPKERSRLENLVNDLEPKGKIIIRTKAKDAIDLTGDIQNLYQTWDQIQKNKRKTPGLILSELPLIHRILRDELNHPQSQIWIDQKEVYEKAKVFLKQLMPSFVKNIHHYKKSQTLFEHWGIEKKLNQALRKTVYLKSGGAIVIEETEAMVSIDINTGKFVGKKDQEKTVLKTNLEAVKEIASQLRIRNLGGMIVIDLIDMSLEASKKKVIKELELELKKDRVYTEVVSLSELNLLQMTRKRTGPSLHNQLHQKCLNCNGSGKIRLRKILAFDIFREIESQNSQSLSIRKTLLSRLKRKKPIIHVIAHPLTVQWIQKEELQTLSFLKRKTNSEITFKSDDSFLTDYFQVECLSD